MKQAPAHPYRDLPDSSFWKRSVASAGAEIVPLLGPAFSIAADDVIASAGSCFAQNVARHLLETGAHFLMAEPPVAADAPIFSARFGNIYTVRQLVQLFERAYGIFRPADKAWRTAAGRFVDPFRPQLFADGFASLDALESERRSHLAAVRRMFETCTVFVFTLGLTEAWLAADGAALPLPPGAVAQEVPGDDYVFRNFTVGDMTADLRGFLGNLKAVNPAVRVILTVSPVPMVATYERRHVLVSNAYSKAALRVTAEETVKDHSSWVDYFPSYEMLTAPAAAARYFAADLRTITPAGIAYVMAVFDRHYRDAAPVAAARGTAPATAKAVELTAADEARLRRVNGILCDENRLDDP